MKKYIVSEDTLKRLLEDSIELAMLNADGVDNWTWYGEGDAHRGDADVFPGRGEQRAGSGDAGG